MKKKSTKVLMLGWEFPPVINGGLGVACHDLCAAMSEHASISMIIPKSDPDFLMKNIELIGVNHVDVKNFANVPLNYDFGFAESVDYVPSNINPYYTEAVSEKDQKAFFSYSSSTGALEPFNIDSLYGGDVIRKVIHFSKIATQIALTKEFDVIHAHDWMTMVAGMEIKARTGKPLVVHVHSLEYDRSGENSRGWVYDLEKMGMEAADLLLPVSNYTGEIIKNHYGINPIKIFPVHNGIKREPTFKTTKPFEEKVVLFVGRLTRQKGPEHFLEIASKVNEYDKNVRFIMAGTGDYFKTLIESSSYRHLGNRFHMTGFLNSEKVKYLLSIADVYCMPSVSEPFGLSAMEAVQFGVPCVISKQSGVAEVLPGSLKFDFWDTDKAAGYILNLLHDDTLRTKVIRDAEENLTNVSWDISANKVIDAYTLHNISAN